MSLIRTYSLWDQCSWLRSTLHWLCIVYACIGSLTLTAQNVTPEIISTAGDSYQKEGVLLHWTIGEMVVDHFEQPTSQFGIGFLNTLDHKFQDSMTFLTTSVIEEEIAIDVRVFPNPSSDLIRIETVRESFESYEIVSQYGNIIERGGFKEHQEISVDNLTTGPYWIYLITKDGERAVVNFIKQ